MHRFYLPPDQCRDTVLTLHDREAHHALHVVRLRPGERVIVLDGAGHEFLCETVRVAQESVDLKVVQKNSIARLPYQLTLLQAVPKGKLIETIIQKATELGVFRIVPLLSERVAARFDEESAENKLVRWRLTLIEAAKQCGSAWLPRIEAPLSTKAFLARGERFDLTLIASLQPDSRHPRDLFQTYFMEHGGLPETTAIWIGPEGDFTPAEISAAKSAGALPITLGRHVLRAETAAIYGLSILNYELQSKYR